MDIRIRDLIGLCILLRIETYFSFQTSGTQNTVCRNSEKILFLFMLDSNKKGIFMQSGKIRQNTLSLLIQSPVTHRLVCRKCRNPIKWTV